MSHKFKWKYGNDSIRNSVLDDINQEFSKIRSKNPKFIEPSTYASLFMNHHDLDTNTLNKAVDVFRSNATLSRVVRHRNADSTTFDKAIESHPDKPELLYSISEHDKVSPEQLDRIADTLIQQKHSSTWINGVSEHQKTKPSTHEKILDALPTYSYAYITSKVAVGR